MGEMLPRTAEDVHTLSEYRDYGGAIAEHAQEKPRCPVLLHWGETDQLIPPDHWKKVSAAHPNLPMHVSPAGHGFNCDERGSYHEPSATLACTGRWTSSNSTWGRRSGPC